MIQRFLYTALQSGLAKIRDDSTVVDDIFKQYDLPDKELAAINTLMATKFPVVKHQYARTDDDFPLISIVLGSEAESDSYLGDYVQQNEDHSELVSAIWESTFDILIYTEHPDHTLYLYEMVKAIVVSEDLNAFGLFQTHFSGQDLAPDIGYIPAHLFVRKFTIRAQREFESVDRLVAAEKAFKVAGIHIDKAGSPSDVGGVKTLVSPDGDGEL